MGWETSDRRSRLPADWQKIRLRVLRRDGYRCQMPLSSGGICGAPARDVDHVQRGDDHSTTNLRALCPYCHGQKTAREGAAAAPRRASRKRAPEKHPGAL